MVNIINLTNSTWEFIDGLNPNETIVINVNFVSNDFEYDKISFERGTGLIYIKNSNPTVVYPMTDGVGVWVNEESRTITITGGKDVENAEAINKLKEMAIYISGGTVEPEPDEPEIEPDEPEEEIIYTASVSGLGNEDYSTINFTIDSSFPTIFETITTNNGNQFIKIPTLYRKIDNIENGQITAFTIATGKINNNYVPYSVFKKTDGKIMPYVLVGKYKNSSRDTIVSTNSSTSGLLTLNDARNKVRSLDEGYQLYDWQFHKLIQDLCLITSQTVKFADSGSSVTSFLGIEDFDENVFLDGVTINGLNYFISYNPDKYVDNANASSDGYEMIGYDVPQSSSSRCISKLGYDENNSFFNFPEEIIVDATYSKYYCDGFYVSNVVNGYNGSITVNLGSNDNDSGIWYMRSDSSSSDDGNVRLCFRPVALSYDEPDIPVNPENPEEPEPDEPDTPTEGNEYETIDEFFTAVGNAIRTKKGTTEPIKKQNIPDEILSIETGVQEISTEQEMNALLIADNVGKVYRFVGVTGTYVNGDLYEVVSE